MSFSAKKLSRNIASSNNQPTHNSDSSNKCHSSLSPVGSGWLGWIDFLLWFVAPRLFAGVIDLELLLWLSAAAAAAPLVVWLQEEVEFGYGTQAERWSGMIRDIDSDKADYGGLPPGTEVMMAMLMLMENIPFLQGTGRKPRTPVCFSTLLYCRP